MMSPLHKRALRVAIDLSAIEYNFNVVRTTAGGQKIFAVVKADAYGHGAVRVATALDQANGFAVVTVQEAVELRDASITKPILVLQGAHTAQQCAAFIDYGLWPVIHCQDQLDWFTALPDAAKLQPWIKIDSGMGRLGFKPDVARTLLTTNQKLKWIGALTHFANADDPEHQQTEQQIHTFTALTQNLSLHKSLANSAGVLAWPSSRADWARPGIMLYGSNPIVKPLENPVALRPAMRVSAPLISRKRYNLNDTIGYAAGYVCPEAMDVGYLAIGYGDGLPRVLDQSANVLINGHVRPIIGRVSMDSIAIDLRNTSAEVGCEAVLWGAEHPVEHLAAAANTISYELMTSIQGERVYI